MSALGDIIETAVAGVIAEHPRLFDAKQRERAHKILARDILKALTREPRGQGEAEAVPAASPAAGMMVPVGDDIARAYIALRMVAGAVSPMREGDRVYVPAVAQNGAVLAFAALPPEKNWCEVNHQQATAWREFFADALPDISRRVMSMFPWPWPPSKTGKVYDAPPSGEDAA